MAYLKINGVEVTAPIEITIGIQEISNANRNANGLMIKERIAIKDKLTLKWNVLGQTETNQILSLVDVNFFEATYMHPQTGEYVTKTFYTGDKSVGTMTVINGVVKWKDLAFDIIER